MKQIATKQRHLRSLLRDSTDSKHESKSRPTDNFSCPYTLFRSRHRREKPIIRFGCAIQFSSERPLEVTIKVNTLTATVVT